MKRLTTVIAVVAALTAAMAAPAIAADLSNGDGQTCEGPGIWHFVNNQTGRGAPAGELTAVFDDGEGGTITVTVGASDVNRNMQHFYVETDGDATLVSASTDLPGKLVLSDFDCDGGKKEEPPK